jgi:hypothetical protein
LNRFQLALNRGDEFRGKNLHKYFVFLRCFGATLSAPLLHSCNVSRHLMGTNLHRTKTYMCLRLLQRKLWYIKCIMQISCQW